MKQLILQWKFGGARRDRTVDLYNAIVALSQLSYGPTECIPERDGLKEAGYYVAPSGVSTFHHDTPQNFGDQVPDAAVTCQHSANSASSQTMDPTSQPDKLKRTLNLPLLTLYGLGTVIGAGIYALVGEIAGAAGYGAPLSFLIASMVAGFSACSFAELAARFPQAAGAAFTRDTSQV